MNRSKSKIRTGVALEINVVKEMDDIVQNNKDLGLTRSEVINAILQAYIKSDHPYTERVEKLREFIIKIRKGLLSIVLF